MVNVGPLEILLVAIIALVVLGPARLPEMARSVGRGMREFRSALNSAGEDDEDDLASDDEHDDETDEDEKEDDDPAAAEAPEELPEGR